MPESRLARSIFRQSLVLLAVVCCITTTLWAAEAPRVAGIQIGPEQITWTPAMRADRWLLTVSGQGIYLRETYQEGELPSVRAIAPDGAPLADGSYRWELRALPSEQDAQATQLEEEGDGEQVRRVETSRGTFERRVVTKPVVTSGSFVVQEGGFVVPAGEPESAERD